MAPGTTQSATVMLYDGWCSLCTKSAEKFRTLDDGRGIVECVDLRVENALLEKHGLDASEVRRVMHVITPDGEVLVAMDALREILRVLGRGWMLGWTRVPIVRWCCDRVYLLFARHRLRFFGRKADESVH